MLLYKILPLIKSQMKQLHLHLLLKSHQRRNLTGLNWGGGGNSKGEGLPLRKPFTGCASSALLLWPMAPPTGHPQWNIEGEIFE